MAHLRARVSNTLEKISRPREHRLTLLISRLDGGGTHQQPLRLLHQL